MTDSLTGLMNRRGFEDYLRRVAASAERYDEKGVLVYIDRDDFKPINTKSATTWETPCSTSSHVFSLRTSARPIPLPG
jgi:GGDEF domain-containing protein